MGWIGEDDLVENTKYSGDVLQTDGSVLFVNASRDRLNLDIE